MNCDELIIKDIFLFNYFFILNDSGCCVVFVCLYNVILFYKKSCIR